MSTGSNQGRVHAASASPELALLTVGRVVAKPLASYPGWSPRRALGLVRRQLDRLAWRGVDEQYTVQADLMGEDRRRIAADVHDLIMQDLSFALAMARTLVEEPASARQASLVVEAGERALAGAREVLQGLLDQDREPVVEAVEASVRAAARDTPLRFHANGVQVFAHPDRTTHDALVHIGREAVTNAVKHAGSDADVEVVFEHSDEWRLTVRDNGRGFDPSNTARGFGLESMCARAQDLGGSLRVSSAVGEGATVEVALP
jgi:signal transduction histidine kinase